MPDDEERHAQDHRDEGDQLGRLVDLALERRGLLDDRLRQRGDPPELRVHAGPVDDRLRVAARAQRPGEDEVLGLEHRRRRLRPLSRPRHRLRLARQRRHVDLDGAIDQPRVGRKPVAFGQQQQIARDQVDGLDLDENATPAHARPGRQQVAQRLGGVLGLALLGEGERRVQHDHDDDRHGQGEHAGGERQRGRHPQQERQRVRELAEQAAPGAGTAFAADLVAPDLEQAPGGLAVVEPLDLRA